MFSKRAPIGRRKPSDAEIDDKIDELRTELVRLEAVRLELAEFEQAKRDKVQPSRYSARPGAAGKLTVSDLVDLGIVLEESRRLGREMTQIEQAKLLGAKDSRSLNNRLSRLEAKLDGSIYEPGAKNRSGRLTFDGWEFAMCGILLRDLVALSEALSQRRYEDILRRLVWSLRDERNGVFDALDEGVEEDELPTSGLGMMAAGIRGFHWLDPVGPAVRSEDHRLRPLPKQPRKAPREQDD